MKNYKQTFWGEIAPSDHLLQIYENDEVFLHALEGFTGNGLLEGDAVIVIATEVHLSTLEEKLKKNFDIESLKWLGQYIPMTVDNALSKFMVEGRVNEDMFRKLISGLITKARQYNRSIRAFGEMVAVLWGQGNREATYALENLWNGFCQTELKCLFCAYPKAGFRQDAIESINHICSYHSKMVDENKLDAGVNLYGEKLSISTIR